MKNTDHFNTLDLVAWTEPAAYWSFDGSRNGMWFAAYRYPNRFHRWMHKVLFGITWKEKP